MAQTQRAFFCIFNLGVRNFRRMQKGFIVFAHMLRIMDRATFHGIWLGLFCKFVRLGQAGAEFNRRFLRIFAANMACHAEKIAHIHRKRRGDYEIPSSAT